MSRWWRAYDEALHDPKLIALSDRLFRAWFNLLCFASKHGGVLPPTTLIATELRTTVHRVAEWITALVAADLIDEIEPGRFAPHNWSKRQFQSDVSTERVKRFRAKPRNVSLAVTETPPETETETETEKKKEDPPDGGSSAYAFESGVIRLNQRDLDAWKAAFSHLDVPAELTGLSEWASKQPRWFFAVSGALAKRNRDQAARLEADKAKGDKKWNGIEGVL